jgi:alpha-tubulin suppressor-like RCC1 family protein
VSHVFLSALFYFSITAYQGIRIMQMSAGVDMSMAVSTKGDVYAWGKATEGRLGLGTLFNEVKLPRHVPIPGKDGAENGKAVDVECGYVHSIIVGLDGTIHMCGGVGIDGEDDGQKEDMDDIQMGK